MQRRNFVKNSAILALGMAIPVDFTSLKKWYAGEEPLKAGSLAPVSDKLQSDFNTLLAWMKSNGWTAYLQQALDVNFELTGDDLKKELIKTIGDNKLNSLRDASNSGYDDFSGERLVQPGFPAFSLLFHTLASPRVRPAGITAYPSLSQIDLLENYICALIDWKELKSIYKITSNSELVFAVFAYEYRPAFKTPHHAYADMVYSRTGIARIGDRPLHYDAVNRCHTNQPIDDEHIKQVAVIPARYGLYIARKVRNSNISLVKNKYYKGADSRDDRHDASKYFLQPIRKVFNDDVLVGNTPLQYTETHKSEKLDKLIKTIGSLHNLKPEPRDSKDLIEQDKKICSAGSSFLVVSKYDELIRTAKSGGHTLFFEVPKQVTAPYDTRYFTALCTQEVEDVELLTGNKNLSRVYNYYDSPRNKPLFVNITNEADDPSKETYHALTKTTGEHFEEKMQKGKYYAPLFEDSICDGKVTVHIDASMLQQLNGITAHCLPAFSVVTAPDFFPQVDPIDLNGYDVAPGDNKESSFYEGGVASLSTARIKPNPKMIDTKTDLTGDTYLAVLSGAQKEKNGIAAGRIAIYQNPAAERGYDISGFLPDVASSVFAPGWDVTYCSMPGVKDIYIGTEGLGSPFVEDMKFCAALNGMWAATSPDASRTYQGSNEAKYRNPTAVPLLDNEIGICADGPAGKAGECFGWDGEQGPFLEKNNAGKWMINFTDLGRADAVNNALDGKLDMSKLRKLKSNELIHRMECLKRCIKTLPQKNFYPALYKTKITGYTYLWLVSAEKVNWGNEDAAALGIPADLVGNSKDWITGKANAKVSGEGYLYVFANSAADEENKRDWAPDLKRRRLDCEQLYACQVTNNPASAYKIAWTEIKNGTINWQTDK